MPTVQTVAMAVGIDFRGEVSDVERTPDENCPHCPELAPDGWDPVELIPLWLHAKRYTGDDGVFDAECPDPEWAAEGFCVRSHDQPGIASKTVVNEDAPNALSSDGTMEVATCRKRLRVC